MELKKKCVIKVLMCLRRVSNEKKKEEEIPEEETRNIQLDGL